MTEHNNPQDNVTVPRELLLRIQQHLEREWKSVEPWSLDDSEALSIELQKVLEQPAVEPVAWMVRNGCVAYQLMGSKAQADALAAEMQKRHDLSGSLASFRVCPLYTAPQAQPTPVQEPENLQCKTVQKRLATQWGLHDLVEISSRENEASTIIHLSN